MSITSKSEITWSNFENNDNLCKNEETTLFELFPT